jgi:glycosyltransferase involved in cell wall biosynthesis
MECSVSVVIPFHNNFNDLVRALNSVLNQSCLPNQVIIVDDQSSYFEDVLRLSNSIKTPVQILLHQNSINSGPGVSRNNGIKLAKSKYIAFLDEDDTWHPNKLEFQIRTMENNDHSFSFTKSEFIGDANKELSSSFKIYQINRKRLLFKNIIPTRSVVLRRNVIENLLFNPNMRYAEDFEYWLRISRKYKIFKYDFVGSFSYKYDYCGGLSSKLIKMFEGELYAISNNEDSFITKFILIYIFYPIKLIKRFISQFYYKIFMCEKND